jgi:hypothetical protein
MTIMKFALRACAAVAFTLSAAAASAGVINFDDLRGDRLGAGELVTNQYAGMGVTFSDSFTGGAHAENFLGTLMPGSSSPNVLWTDQGGGSASPQFLQVNFATAVTSVSALFGTSLGADITLEIYDGASLIGSLNTTGATTTGDVRSGTIGLTGANITSARFFSRSGQGTSFNFSIDDLTWDGNQVPEPASVLLVLGALGALGATARRRAAV